MRSWRAIVLDVLRGVDTDTGESVRDAIARCGCEPPGERSGSLREAIGELQEASKKIGDFPPWFSDMTKDEERKWFRGVMKPGLDLVRLFFDEGIGMEPGVYALIGNFRDKVRQLGFDDRSGSLLDFPASRVNQIKETGLAKWQKENTKMRKSIETSIEKLEGQKGKIKEKREKEKEFNKNPCTKVFQRLVFGIEQGKYGTREQNTKREEEIEMSVSDWIGGDAMYSDGHADDKMVADFQFIKKCVKDYPNEFEPTVSVVWRGIGVDGSVAKRILPLDRLLKSKDLLEIGKGKKAKTYVGVPVEYKANRAIQSWAAEPAVAAHFATQEGLFGGSVSVLPSPDVKFILKQANGFKAASKADKKSIVRSIVRTMDYAYKEIMEGMNVPIVYTMPTDDGCIFSEWFANILGTRNSIGKETEVTRIVRTGTKTPAKAYVNQTWVELIKKYNEVFDELQDILGSDMPEKVERIE